MVTSPRRGEVYWVDLDPVLGSEQAGRRPAVIVQNDIGNEYAATTIIVPLTTRRPARSYPFIVEMTDPALGGSSWAHCGQVRTIDKKRLQPGAITTLDLATMSAVDEALLVSLGMY